MELNEAQKQSMARWISEGKSISDVQKLMAEEFGEKLTYADVRFLIIDMGLNVRDKKTPAKPAAVPEEAPELMPGALGGVRVEVDRLANPKALVSGSVVFSDGVSATWMLDQFGRLALDASQPGYRPSEADLKVFQEELARELQKRGY